jgi:hypothetical protein
MLYYVHTFWLKHFIARGCLGLEPALVPCLVGPLFPMLSFMCSSLFAGTGGPVLTLVSLCGVDSCVLAFGR